MHPLKSTKIKKHLIRNNQNQNVSHWSQQNHFESKLDQIIAFHQACFFFTEHSSGLTEICVLLVVYKCNFSMDPLMWSAFIIIPQNIIPLCVVWTILFLFVFQHVDSCKLPTAQLLSVLCCTDTTYWTYSTTRRNPTSTPRCGNSCAAGTAPCSGCTLLQDSLITEQRCTRIWQSLSEDTDDETIH